MKAQRKNRKAIRAHRLGVLIRLRISSFFLAARPELPRRVERSHRVTSVFFTIMHKLDLYFFLRKHGVPKHYALSYALLWSDDQSRMSKNNFEQLTREPPRHPK